MLNQIINMVMRTLVRQGVNSAIKRGQSLVKQQMDKRKAAQKPPVDDGSSDQDLPPKA